MEQSLWAPLTDHIVELISLILTALVSIAIAYLKKAVENSQFKDSFNTTLEAIDTLSKNTVSNLAAATKEALADGKITADEKANIQALAKHEFNLVISPTMVKRLNVHMNDADKFITAKINETIEKAMADAVK